MILTNATLKTLLTGAVSFIENDGWLTPCRYSAAQRERLAGDERFAARSKATSGVTLDFVTDSTSLAFDARIRPGAPHKGYGVDICVDGRIKGHFGNPDLSEDDRHFEMELGEGEKRVTVWFPNLSAMSLRNVTVDDGASLRPAEKSGTLLFVGDSITMGYFADFSSMTYANLTAASLGMEAFNHAIGGEFFDPDKLDRDCGLTPDRIIVAYGTNDWNQKRNLRERCPAYFDALRALYPDARVDVLLPIWRADSREKEAQGWQSFMEMRADIAVCCEGREGFHVVDDIELVPHFPEFFRDSRLHPNELGFAEYAKNLSKYL